MKFNKYIKHSLLGFALLAAAGCDDFLDINDDPDSPTDVTVDQILPSVQVTTAFRLGNTLQRITGAVSQHLAGVNNQILRYDTYDFQSPDFDGPWDGTYAGSLLDLKRIRQLAEENGDNTYLGISYLMTAYNFSIMTDLWGDIPFSEALQEIEELAPDFQDQEGIYDGIFVLIDNGVAALGQAEQGTDPGAKDLIYGGSVEQWVKFANTLRVKLHLQIRKRRSTASATAINALIADDNLMVSNADNFSLDYTPDLNNQHPMYAFAYLNRAGDIAISQRLIDSMAVLNDPRIPFYFNNNNQASENDPDSLIYNGYDNGSTFAAPVQAERARLGAFPVGDNGEAPQRMLTYYQLQFMLAEATLELSTTGDARVYYENAMRAALAEAGVETDPIDDYVDARLVEYDAAVNNSQRLNLIMRDKWVSLFGNGIDAWTDWRRTGFPQLDPSTTANSPDGLLPRKFLIPQDELSSNKNVPPQVLISDRVWWDVE